MPPLASTRWLEAAGPGDAALAEVRDALDDDLDTPRALAAIDGVAAAGHAVSTAAELLGVELTSGDEEPVKRP